MSREIRESNESDVIGSAMSHSDAPSPQSDEAAILALFNRYFFAYDRADRDLLAACFMPDVECKFDVGGPPAIINGRDAVVDSMVGAVLRRTGSNHMVSNFRIEVAGDTARSDMQAIAHIVYGKGESGRVLVRGLRYLDELRRTAAGWRLARREHIALWQFESPTLPPQVPGA